MTPPFAVFNEAPMTSSCPFGRCALFIAHPGHELRVHGWLEAVQPTVYVLTDGSGRSARSRLASTTRLLLQAGARVGSLYGRYPDRLIYEAILKNEVGLFRSLVTELADELAREKFDFVLGDAEEGAILTHDVWRSVVNAAVSKAETPLGRPIANFEFDLEGPPGGHISTRPSGSIRNALDDAALARKIAAARSYPELQSEVAAAFLAYGEEAFRLECFRPSRVGKLPAEAVSTGSVHRGVPAYERHGETLCAAGVYPAVVRYEEHVAPLLGALFEPRRAA